MVGYTPSLGGDRGSNPAADSVAIVFSRNWPQSCGFPETMFCRGMNLSREPHADPLSDTSFHSLHH